MTDIVGRVHVTMREAACYGGRRIHLRIDGLPGWLLSIIGDAGPFKLEASTYSCGQWRDESGPYSVLLGSTNVVATTEPAPYPVQSGTASSDTETGSADK